MPLRAIFLLAFLIGSLPVCFIRPFYGIILWTVIGFLNPQSFLWGALSDFPWAMAIAIPTIAGFVLFESSWRGLNSREVKIVLILWGWFAITTVNSISTPIFMHHAADTWYRLDFVSKILLMTILMIPIVRTFERLRILIIVVALSFGFFVAKAFPFVIMSGGTFRVYGPEHSMISDNNDLGLALNMTLPFYFFLAKSEEKRWMKVMFGSLFVMAVPVIFSSWSRGAMVGLIAVFCVLWTSVSANQRLILTPVIGGAIVIGLLFSPAAWRNRMDPTREGAIDPSAQARLNVWQFSRNLAADYPIAGGGFGTFTPELFARYGPPGQPAMAPHSVYFQLLAEHGFVGLGIYLTMLGSFFLTTRRLIKNARQRDDYTICYYAKMLQVALVGFCTSGMFLGRAYFDYLFFMVSCLAILQRVAWDAWMRADNQAVEEPQEAELAALDSGDAVFGT